MSSLIQFRGKPQPEAGKKAIRDQISEHDEAVKDLDKLMKHGPHSLNRLGHAVLKVAKASKKRLDTHDFIAGDLRRALAWQSSIAWNLLKALTVGGIILMGIEDSETARDLIWRVLELIPYI